MKVAQGSITGEVEYRQLEDGTWSFVLVLDGDPVPITSEEAFATRELAEAEVDYLLTMASLRRAEG
jgi:hypothetical protein